MSFQVSALGRLYSENSTIAYYVFSDLVVLLSSESYLHYHMSFKFVCLSGEKSWVQMGQRFARSRAQFSFHISIFLTWNIRSIPTFLKFINVFWTNGTENNGFHLLERKGLSLVFLRRRLLLGWKMALVLYNQVYFSNFFLIQSCI